MSGHSKWSTIKRQKGVADAKRGQAFTKLAKNITMAIKTGGGTDPNFNFQLRTAIEKAKEVSMPKDNIDRAVKRGSGEGKEAIQQVTYEGYGPGGVAIVVDAITDNSNRTYQSVRNILVKHDGKMGGEGTVAWMFTSKGEILVEKQAGTDELSLELIDQGVEDVKESEEGLEIYTAPNDLEKTKKFIESQSIKILSAEVIMKSSQTATLSESDLEKLHALIEALEDDDDVVSVHTNSN